MLSLIRGVDGIRHLFEASNSQNNNEQAQQTAQISSKMVEDIIETCLEHFAHEDATLLAEAYHSRVGTERSLLILAHCLTRARSFENAYHLLKTVGNPTAGATGLKTAKCRYLFAYCAFTLNRLQEAENTLRDMAITDKVQLHPSFQGAPSLPYAHSLLAKILCETDRIDLARTHWAHSVRHNPMLWTALRAHCDVGGGPVRVLLQPSFDELARWRAETGFTSSSSSHGSAKDKEEQQQEDEQMEESMEGGGGTGGRGGRRTPARTSSRSRGGGRKSTATTTAGSTTTTPPSSQRTTTIGTARKPRLRSNPTAASLALRASENSPLTRSNKLGGPTSGGRSLLIEQQKQQDEKEEQLLSSLNKRVTRHTIAVAKAEAASRDREMEMQKLEQQQIHQDRQIYYELLDWLLQLAEVQELLSKYRCADAFHLLNTLKPRLFQLPLSMELHARVFFENGEYKRACEVFEEIRRLYPRRVQGMEIYSTALWQLHDAKKLSALAAEMSEVAREQPETWCIAGNCFSLEKQHEMAIECLERTIRLDNRFGYAYSLLGHELIDMNDLVRAEQAFRKAIVYSPSDYRAWYGLGLVHFKEEKLQMARMYLNRAVQINPSNTVLLCQLAVIEQALQCNDAAMRYLERALKHQPNNVPCRFHKARLLFDTGRYAQAKTELEELKVLSPDEANVFFLLGRVNRKLGNTHMALLNFSWATEIDPRGEQNQSALTTDKGPYDDEPIN